jgi:hypothetical protein
MATSGSTDFNQTAIQVIEGAFSLAGVKAQEQGLQPAEIADGFAILNLMVKTWQNQGLHLWTKEEGIIFLRTGVTDYTLGVAGDESTNLDDFIGTELTGGASALATTLVVTSTAGMLALDNIGIELADGTRQWTTIVSVDSPTGLTITTGLTSGASIDGTVYTYTNELKRPLRVLGVRRGETGQETEIEVIPFDSRSHYFNQPNKTNQGTVVNYYYSPGIPNGRFYIWQTADNVNKFVRITFERPIEDFDNNSDDPDFPVEWTETIKYNLGYRVGLEYGINPGRLDRIKVVADEMLGQALGYDVDNLKLNVQPDFG